MRKGRGCMLQYQHSTLRVLTHFIAQADAEVPPDPLTGAEPVEYFLGPEKWFVTQRDRKSMERSMQEDVKETLTFIPGPLGAFQQWCDLLVSGHIKTEKMCCTFACTVKEN